jgi:ABC-type transport system involved in Fe-S cluster assembly fused permease/ATPase subunit
LAWWEELVSFNGFCHEDSRHTNFAFYLGSGKSTIMIALFRLVELAEGQIFVDGLDISKMGLFDLRTRLAIIPQGKTMF